jgi:hypothetical protein
MSDYPTAGEGGETSWFCGDCAKPTESDGWARLPEFRHSRAGLRAAYELGRRAMGERLSMLDLARIHHSVLLDVLKSHRNADELEDIARAASEFLVEALATFEMTQRGFMELRDAASAEFQDGSDD